MVAAITRLAVCGLHRLGQPLNAQLTDLGASYVKTCRSSPNYKLYVLPGQVEILPDHNGRFLVGGLAKPGMVYVKDESGQAIELEIWEIEVAKLGHFMLKVPWPLAIGTVKLQGGDSCLGFVAEGVVAIDLLNKDITYMGSWLEYVKSQEQVN